MHTFDAQAVVAVSQTQVNVLFQRQANSRTLLDDRDFVPLPGRY